MIRNTTESQLFNPCTQPLKKQYNYLDLFRYALGYDYLLIILCSLSSLIAGASMPIMSLIFGSMTNTFQQESNEEMIGLAQTYSMYFLLVGGIIFLMNWMMYFTSTLVGERQGIQFRKHYLQSLMNQEIVWFDDQNQNELNSKMNLEIQQIQESVSEKFAQFICNASTSMVGIILALVLGWQYALVVLATIPIMSISIVYIVIAAQKLRILNEKLQLSISSVVEQALCNLKIIKYFNGQYHECQKIKTMSNDKFSTHKRNAFLYGLAFGVYYFIQLCIYVIGCYYGFYLISEEVMNQSSQVMITSSQYYKCENIVPIFFCIIWGCLKLSEIAPALSCLKQGVNAGRKAFEIIDRIPKKLTHMEGKILQDFAGEVEFKNVEFQYERSDKVVLKGINFKVKAGQRVAFVGRSGCGKSTIFSLIQKFYETYSGSILIGSEQIETKELDSNDFYRQIVVVNQEPALFSGSIKENLLFGNQTASDEEIRLALRQSNAIEFIEKLPSGWDTNVGTGGNQLSGGQKQRIAIARALLKKPKLILLDEATSALDRVNEKKIQQTLDLLSKNTTTLIIAHRLTTVQNADVIYMIEDGIIVEQGNHKELMAKGGKYAELVSVQLNEIDGDIFIDDGEIEQVQVHKQEIEIINSNEANLQKNQQSQDLNKIQLKYSVIFRLILFCKSALPIFVLGAISALINGCIFPVFSIYESKQLTSMITLDPKLYPNNSSLKAEKYSEIKAVSIEISLAYTFLGIIYAIFTAFEIYCLHYFAAVLVKQIRVNLLKKFTTLPQSFFDLLGNNVAKNTSYVTEDSQRVYQLMTFILGQKLQQISAYATGFAIAFYNSWIITLVAVGISPISYLSRQFSDKYFIKSQASVIGQVYSTPENLSMEIIHNIRTVCSFNNKDYLINKFMAETRPASQAMQKIGFFSGIAQGLTECQIFIINATLFYLGALFISYDLLTVDELYGALFAILFTILGGTKAMKFDSDMPKSILASNQIFDILDKQDEYQLSKGSSTLKQEIIGNIEFKNVSFKYPSRDQLILNNLNLIIKQGEKIGLVGESGCGKSTIIQLITRLYEPTEGQILIDNVDIREYDLDHLRKQVQVITQEPSLFDGTIEQNIRYNLEHISFNHIFEVSKQAEAYDFIIKDFEQQEELGYQKQVGMKGVNLSGGQKQRIAIARTLLRDGRILLLDEATSALDTKTEDVVQKNIDQMMKSKTRITVAHRFNTIMDSDIIHMFENGQIVESGKFEDLINLKGSFFNLQQGIQKEQQQEIP